MSSAEPYIVDIKRKKGNDYDLLIGVVDKVKNVIPLTTEVFVLGVSSIPEPTEAADIFTAAGAIVDGPNGKVSFPIPGTTPAGTYYYDILMTDTAGKDRTIASGQYIIKQDRVS